MYLGTVEHLPPARARALAALCLAGLCACGDTSQEGEATEGSETCVAVEPPEMLESGTDEEPELDLEGLEFVSLVDHEAWTQLDAIADPLAEHRPATVTCSDLAGYYPENDNQEIEVDTNVCNYLAIHQPSLASITPGQVIRVRYYHFDLAAPEPAQAHLQISVDGHVLADYFIEIVAVEDGPGARAPAAFKTETIVADFCAPAGAQIVFHVHNHGQNTWAMRELEVSR